MVSTKRHNDWLLGCLFCGSLVFLFGVAELMRGSDEVLHWFLIPLVLCGILVAVDAVRWFSGGVDVLSPIGVLGVFGVHFFLLAPLLHLRWGYWMDEVSVSPQSRAWLGAMAAVNLAGLVALRATRAHFASAAGRSGTTTTWRLQPKRFRRHLTWALLLAGALQVWVYARFGGLWGYLSAVEQEEHTFLGSGRIAMISESFPILAMMAYAAHVRWRRRTPSWAMLCLVMAGFVVLKLLFGGLHGRRADVIFAVFWAVGIIHFCIRPVPRKLVLGGFATAVAFAYFFGFYKSAGLEGLQMALRSSDERATIADEVRRPLQSTILGDMGRSDVQAFLFHRTTDPGSDYRYACGRTYLGAGLTLIPGPLWRDRPPTKVKEGTEAIYGRGSYRPRSLSSTRDKDKYVGMTSRVFGLAGEAMLNFGPLAVPVAFAVLGIAVGCVQRWMTTWRRGDARWMVMPFFVYICFTALIGDSDNVIKLLEEDGLFPCLIVLLGSTIHRRAAEPAGGRSQAGIGSGVSPESQPEARR